MTVAQESVQANEINVIAVLIISACVGCRYGSQRVTTRSTPGRLASSKTRTATPSRCRFPRMAIAVASSAGTNVIECDQAKYA